MGDWQIWLPDEVFRALEQRAIGHDRSVEAEAAAILTAAVSESSRVPARELEP
ncbi:FitA-like ribbon-helix-helix domain-containing protein [Nocardia carnea]|uniref:FitA-like ribbon-helix-helix domain-containing protein n=1 Tax=Nocardia carnea TaxID=37328 RepID=UPI0024587F64|nr:hypothetical protein [Nocardia carnea]